MKDKIKALFLEATENKVELSDDFFDSITQLVESKVSTIVDKKKKSLNESYENKLVKQKNLDESKYEELTNKLNDFMKHALNEWAIANEPVLNSNIMVESAQNLFNSMKFVMESCNMEIDEDGKKKIDEAENRVGEIKSELNESEKKLVVAETKIQDMKKENIRGKVFDNYELVESQKERITALSDDIDFKSDDQFEEKFKLIVESVIDSEKNKKNTLNEKDGEVIVHKELKEPESLNEDVTDPYLKAFLA